MTIKSILMVSMLSLLPTVALAGDIKTDTGPKKEGTTSTTPSTTTPAPKPAAPMAPPADRKFKTDTNKPTDTTKPDTKSGTGVMDKGWKQ